MRFSLGLLRPLALLLLPIGCQMPNPAFDESGEGSETRGQDSLGGDGDGDGDQTAGDGDGDQTAGDGDGDADSTTGDGDGDGDGDPTGGDGDGDSTGDGDGESGDGDGDPNLCNLDETLCEGMCVNTDEDPLHCGDCGMSCPPSQLCGFGTCKPEKFVFATDAKHTGNFLGVEAASLFCNTAALAAQLPPGNYLAWLSQDEKTPAQMFVEDGVFRLRQGEIVAYSLADLLDGVLEVPINRTEFGEPLIPTPACNESVEYAIWTGTAASGEGQLPNCNGWTNGGDVAVGRVGNAGSVTETWSATDCLPLCNTLLPIYCVQQ
jgi:hypothetical protein